MSDYSHKVDAAPPSMSPSSILPTSSTPEDSSLPLQSNLKQSLTITRSDNKNGWIVSHIPYSERTEFVSDFEYCLFPEKKDMQGYLVIRERLATTLRNISDDRALSSTSCSHMHHETPKPYPASYRDRPGWRAFHGWEANRRCPSHGTQDRLTYLQSLLAQASNQVIRLENRRESTRENTYEPFSEMWDRVKGLRSEIGRAILLETVVDADGIPESVTRAKDVPERCKVRFLCTVLKSSVCVVHEVMIQERADGFEGNSGSGNACLYEGCNQLLHEDASFDEGQTTSFRSCKGHSPALATLIWARSMTRLKEEDSPLHSLASDVRRSMATHKRGDFRVPSAKLINEILSGEKPIWEEGELKNEQRKKRSRTGNVIH